MISKAWKIVSKASEVISKAFEIVSKAFEIISKARHVTRASPNRCGRAVESLEGDVLVHALVPFATAFLVMVANVTNKR